MKKTPIFFTLMLIVLTLYGCASESAKQSEKFLPKAFEALIEDVDNFIVVDSVKWICGEYFDDDDDTTLECRYYIHFKYEGSTIERYAEVVVLESTYFSGFRTHVYTYTTSKLLNDEYLDELEWFEKAAKGEMSSYILEITYEVGTLNSRQISKALKAVK